MANGFSDLANAPRKLTDIDVRWEDRVNKDATEARTDDKTVYDVRRHVRLTYIQEVSGWSSVKAPAANDVVNPGPFVDPTFYTIAPSGNSTSFTIKGTFRKVSARIQRFGHRGNGNARVTDVLEEVGESWKMEDYVA